MRWIGLGIVNGGGSALASWVPLEALLVVFIAIVAALFAFGRSPADGHPFARAALRIPGALQRLTGLPGWAVATVGMSLYGLLVAGIGFYSDVAWHVALGRDKNLFTAPHTAIVLGLGFIFLGGALGVLVASLQHVDTGIHWRALRVPWSTVPLLALGVAALSGFPLDELWHRTYGIDVTMWSPTHMLMILGASFSGLACWLVLGEAGIRPTDSAWARGLHVVAAWLTLQGLSAPLGEFSFGVPQFQQMFHPLLLCIAAGFALVAGRLILGRYWMLGIAVVNFGLGQAHLLGGGGSGPVDTRAVGIFVGSALAVEALAALLGVANVVRFAVLSGFAVGTFGLAWEWLWNQGAYQPWRFSLLPDAVVLGTIAAVGSALLGVAFARAAGQLGAKAGWPRLHPALVAVAAMTVLVCIAVPMRRDVGTVSATVHVVPTAAGEASLDVTVEPPDAADRARWFQAGAWQGGGLVTSDLVKVSPGRYRSQGSVPVGGNWKTLVRLHRGGELMAVPVFLPADAEIGAPEISAVDRTQRFEPETRYLLRETHGGARGLALFVYTFLAVVALTWMGAFALATIRTAGSRTTPALVSA